VRANTSRELRLAFDSSVEQYDAGRTRFDAGLISDLTAWAQLRPGDLVLEVGAGTGQLTSALLEAGIRVVALEPGPNMAAWLKRRFQDQPGFTVEASLFEDFAARDGQFAAVVSANAFHWVDPAVSYAKAARLLEPRGTLGLIWNFPILADEDLQRRLNREVFLDDLSDFRRGPGGYVEGLLELLAAGRQELTRSGLFEQPHWVLKTERLVWTTDRYIAFLSSLANGVGLAYELDGRVRSGLAHRSELSVVNHVYIGVARKNEAVAHQPVHKVGVLGPA
jgi:SAM-dependent methyltransferase